MRVAVPEAVDEERWPFALVRVLIACSVPVAGRDLASGPAPDAIAVPNAVSVGSARAGLAAARVAAVAGHAFVVGWPADANLRFAGAGLASPPGVPVRQMPDR